MYNNFLARWSYSLFKVIFSFQVKTVKVDKVGYNPDVIFNIEKPVGIIFQVLRNRGNAVRLIDGKSNHRFKGAVTSYQGNIGTVQGCYHRNINTISKQYLFSHKSSRSMRDGVMHMQDIKLFKTNHVNQPAGKRKLVRRKIKKRVVRYRNLVIIKIFGKKVEACRLVIRYKVHLMTAVGKSLTQLSGHHPASAKGWVTNDSYFH